jgi:hypothetical protein
MESDKELDTEGDTAIDLVRDLPLSGTVQPKWQCFFQRKHHKLLNSLNGVKPKKTTQGHPGDESSGNSLQSTRTLMVKIITAA